jgi:ribosomal protein S18 acetylase RimI-like enzyme
MVPNSFTLGSSPQETRPYHIHFPALYGRVCTSSETLRFREQRLIYSIASDRSTILPDHQICAEILVTRIMNIPQSKQIGFIQVYRPGVERSLEDPPSRTLKLLRADRSDASRLVEIINDAFADDPVWCWLIPDLASRARLWRVYVDAALRYPWVFITGGYETAAVWIPPHGSDILPEDEARLPQLLHELSGDRAPEMLEFLGSIEAAHPRAEPHYYLDFIGTQRKFMHQGIGRALLSENLARIDQEHLPAYLESSNPRNNRLYASLGFDPIGEIQAPAGAPPITRMWRQPR